MLPLGSKPKGGAVQCNALCIKCLLLAWLFSHRGFTHLKAWMKSPEGITRNLVSPPGGRGWGLSTEDPAPPVRLHPAADPWTLPSLSSGTHGGWVCKCWRHTPAGPVFKYFELSVGLSHQWQSFSLLTWMIKNRLQWKQRASESPVTGSSPTTTPTKISVTPLATSETSQQGLLSNHRHRLLFNPHKEMPSAPWWPGSSPLDPWRAVTFSDGQMDRRGVRCARSL